MKNSTKIVISTTTAMLGILMVLNGNVWAEEYHEHDHSETSDGDYSTNAKNHLAGQIKVYVSYSKDPNYYGKALFETNGFQKEYNIEKLAKKYYSPFWINYVYFGFVPDESEVCLTNLDSGRKNCEDTYSGDSRVDIKMPD